MKQTQLTFAVVLLAVVVGVVTFAMNYLGGGSAPKAGPTTPEPGLELLFGQKEFPNDPNAPMASIEREDKSTGDQDYWFVNTNDKPVKLGLVGKNCKCTSVEAYTLDADATSKILGDAKSITSAEALETKLAAAKGKADAMKNARKAELVKDTDSLEVPPGAAGWVRLLYKGEKPGNQNVSARMWMDNPKTGPTVNLDLRLAYFEPLRTQTSISFGTLRDEDLARGVTHHLYCWSSTRPNLKLEVAAVRSRGDAASDPLEVGKPEPLDEDARKKLEAEINTPGSERHDPMGGKVLCAFKIPITARAVSADGKTPFDLGPFRRRVALTSPDVDGEAKSVLVVGRVRGLIEMGGDDEGGDVNFRSFKSSTGKREKVSLHSETPGVTLEVDGTRTPRFLKASVAPMKTAGEGSLTTWTLTVEVKPGDVHGPFPRKDPTYDDCAVYLKASVPGKPPRSLRIAVSGTAGEG